MTGSVENLKNSFIRSTDKGSGDIFNIRIDPETKKSLKLVFIKLMNKIIEVAQAEQVFCQEMFYPNQNTIVKSASEIGSNAQDNNQNMNNSLTRAGSVNSLQSANTNVSRNSNESSKAEL